MGTRASDREFAGAKAGLPALAIGPICRRASDQAVAACDTARNIEIEQRPEPNRTLRLRRRRVMAREAFINWLERKGKELGVRLERGVSPARERGRRKSWWTQRDQKPCATWPKCIFAPRMRLRRSITLPPRQRVKIGGGGTPDARP